MALEFGELNYEEINTALSKVSDWLLERGIGVENNRFALVRKYIQQISIANKERKLQELISSLGQEIVIASLTEAMPFINMHKAFSEQKEHQCIPKTNLKKIVEGPFLSANENGADTTNEARNFLFELELAAILKFKGIDILSFDDISFEINQALFNVQCKRPMTKEALERNVDEALQQLKMWFAKYESRATLRGRDMRGIIALSVDKIFELDQLIVNVPDGESLELYMQKKAENFIRLHGETWRKIIDTRILAVFVYFSCVANVKEKGLLSTGRYTVIDVLTAPTMMQAKDNHRLGSLAKVLSSQS